ncbi:MAG: hypothetical protein M8866_07660, partial [marine benthic group bacterium]|nr:hypothetical protein [Candidatus Benthicola marisminoris]
MWRRARAALAVGVALSVLMNVLVRYVLQRPDPDIARYAWLVPSVYLWFIPIYGAGLALVWWDRWSARTVALMVLITLLVSGLHDAISSSVLYPTEERFYAVALFLFLAAALMPWPVTYQVTLGIGFVLMYPVAGLVASASIPEVNAFWQAQTETSIRHVVVDQTIMVAILAAVSVYITRTLYTMRRELHAASRLGNYVIEEELGKGGMGKVYRAQHALIRRPTAVKVMEAQAARSPEAIARFEREVQLSATLTHPNTITIY